MQQKVQQKVKKAANREMFRVATMLNAIDVEKISIGAGVKLGKP